MSKLDQATIESIRLEILAHAGPEKYNTLVRQYSEAIERGKLRFWQQELFDNYIQQAAMTIDSMALYIQVFQDAEPVVVPEKQFVYPDAPKDALSFAVARSDLAKIQECVRQQPDVIELLTADKLPTWIVCEAGKYASPETIRLLADLGCNLDQMDSNEFTGLSWAVANDRYQVAKTFLELGADPNLGLPLFKIFANSDPRSTAQLLIEHGSDPNQQLHVDDQAIDLVSRSIELEQTELAAYFQSLGVISQEHGSVYLGTHNPSRDDLILDCVRVRFGAIAKGAMEQIVSPASMSPIAIHYIPVDLTAKRSILFTVGLCNSTINCVELILGLPLDWPPPSEAIKSELTSWPIQSMFRIASKLCVDTSPAYSEWTALPNGSPPKAIADGVPFTCWGLCGGKEPLQLMNGNTLRILEMYPLYTEEYNLQLRSGYLELLNRWANSVVPEAIDLARINVGP